VSLRSISVFGLGRVGLVTAACLASEGVQTVCFDTDDSVVSMVDRGESPFFEPRLSELVQRSVKAGLLRVTNDPREAVNESELTIVTVGTPSDKDGTIDLTYVRSACRIIGQALAEKTGWHLVVIKSTVPPKTTETVIRPLIEQASAKRCPRGFGLCANPEFLREGNAVEDTIKPDRIIIGQLDERSGDALESFYREFYRHPPPVLRTTAVNAELVKYANNAFLAVKVSFINNVADVCQRIPTADIETVARGIGLDNRIGKLFLNAGIGWGGSCLPKDVRAFSEFAKSLGTEIPVVDAALHTNEKQPVKVVQVAEKILGSLESKLVALLGLSFKPGTDDMRNAVSVKIIEELVRKGAKVVAYDPRAMANARKILDGKIQISPSAQDCINGADCCIIVTEWDEFKTMQPGDFISRMRKPLVIDGRRIFDADIFSREILYVGIGLGMKNQGHFRPSPANGYAAETQQSRKGPKND